MEKKISINNFSCDDKTSYRIYTSKQTFEKKVDLLLFSKFVIHILSFKKLENMISK